MKVKKQKGCTTIIAEDGFTIVNKDLNSIQEYIKSNSTMYTLAKSDSADNYKEISIDSLVVENLDNLAENEILEKTTRDINNA